MRERALVTMKGSDHDNNDDDNTDDTLLLMMKILLRVVMWLLSVDYEMILRL